MPANCVHLAAVAECTSKCHAVLVDTSLSFVGSIPALIHALPNHGNAWLVQEPDAA